MDRLQIDWSRPLEIERRGQVRSVTGPAHIYRHLAAVQDGHSTSLATAPEEPAVKAVGERGQKPQTSARDAALLERILSGREDDETDTPAVTRRPVAVDLALLDEVARGGF